MIRRLSFVVQHAGFLFLLLAISSATGTAVLGARAPFALRSILGLAIAGQSLVLLGTFGVLRPWVIGALAATALVAGLLRMEWTGLRWPLLAGLTAVTLPLFALALYPPIAFDETLYHLPFVQAMADSGAIRFLPGLRFPIFPELHEALCVPAFLVLGDVAPHLVAVVQVVLLAALLASWIPGRVGLVAAALLLGNPIVIHHATITYVESALMLFVAAGFFCLDRATKENEAWYVPLAGFFFGTACSVKYLALYFAVAAFVWVLLVGPNRGRRALLFCGALLAALTPTYERIFALSGNPLFPFHLRFFRSSEWMMAAEEHAAPLTRALRLFWDMTFARERVNQQPPVSPFMALAFLVTLAAARRDRRAAFLSALFAGYIALFALIMPADTRYLLPLFPLAVIAAAPWISRWRALAFVMSMLSVVAGLAYAGYHLTRLGPLPTDAAQRQQFLERRIPEYRALGRRGPGKIYVCVAEHLQYFGGGDVIGDWVGPLRYEKVFAGRNAGELARTLSQQEIRSLLVSHRCPPAWARLPAPPFFELVYADAGAALWRVAPGLPRDR